MGMLPLFLPCFELSPRFSNPVKNYTDTKAFILVRTSLNLLDVSIHPNDRCRMMHMVSFEVS